MLQLIDNNLWHTVHAFSANGLPITTRMTVVRLPGQQLLVHSPIPLTECLRKQLGELGTVRFIVAPNTMHHLFLAPCAEAFPSSTVYGPKRLRKKRPDLAALTPFPTGDVPEWLPELEHFPFEGIAVGSESLFFHRPSGTLMATDLLQWMQGPLPWSTRVYASLTGVRKELAVPRIVRALVRDRAAAKRSAERVLRWPFSRVVVAHNVIVSVDAHAQVAKAFAVFS